MLERTKVRALPIVNRAASLAPATQACCGVCRSCATTNIFALGFAALGALGLYVRRLARRSQVD